MSSHKSKDTKVRLSFHFQIAPAFKLGLHKKKISKISNSSLIKYLVFLMRIPICFIMKLKSWQAGKRFKLSKGNQLLKMKKINLIVNSASFFKFTLKMRKISKCNIFRSKTNKSPLFLSHKKGSLRGNAPKHC